MDVRPGRSCLAEVCDYVESTFGPLAEQKGLDLVVDIDDGAAGLDRHRRAAAAAGAEEPAVQRPEVHRGPAASRSRSASRRRTCCSPSPTLNDAETVVALQVTDTGIGVPPEKLKLIFEAFQQADGTTSRRTAAPARPVDQPRDRAAARRRDRREQRGRPGQHVHAVRPGHLPLPSDGALPATRRPASSRRQPQAPMLTAAAGAAPGPAELARARTRCTAPRVLVVDDDVRNVFALTSALELHGMQVLYADNGGDGIALLGERPDDRPGADGRHDAGHGRQRDHRADPAACRSTPTCPIVFLTAKAMPGDRERASLPARRTTSPSRSTSTGCSP